MRFISLGSWCGVTISLRGNSLYEQSLPFDYIRSTFIGIIDCFKNNFNNFFPENIEVDIIPNYHHSGKSFRGKYFGFYHHNLYDNNVINDFRRRICRLTELLISSKENIIFVRTIATHNYNDEIELSEKFVDIIKLNYPLLNFILVFIIPCQNSTSYYKNINKQVFIFTLDDTTNDNRDMTISTQYKPIYDYIINNDFFSDIILRPNTIDIQNVYNKWAEVDGVSIVKDCV